MEACLSSCLTFFFNHDARLILKVSYNFWRWMSRLEQRWRTPLNAISVVNGRIPRIKRKLNAYCALRFFPKSMLGSERLHFHISKQNSHRAIAFRDVLVCQWRAPLRRFIHWRIRLNSKCSGCIRSCPASLWLLSIGRVSLRVKLLSQSDFNLCVWTQAGLPAEFKHISKRRTRKWTWFP